MGFAQRRRVSVVAVALRLRFGRLVRNGAFQIAAKTSFSSFFGKRFHSFGYRRRDRFYRASLLFRAYIFYRNTRNPDSREIERLLRIYSGCGDNVRIRNTIARKRARRYGEHSAHGLAPSARICGKYLSYRISLFVRSSV